MLISQRKNRVVVFCLFLSLFVSCSQKKEDDYIAKVGDSFLTESMLEKSIGENEENKIFREEFIRKWIEKKTIYLSAVDKGILESKKYLELIDKAKVEIANAIIIKALIEKDSRVVSNNELENYYVENISEFKLRAELYIYNQVSFSDKSVAKKFRRKLVSNSWEKVVEEFSNNKALLLSTQNKFEYIYNILPVTLRTELNMLDKNRISGVIETSQNIFTILQLIKSYKKGDAPEFSEIAMDIKEKYIAKNRKEIYNNYVEQLYLEYASKIER